MNDSSLFLLLNITKNNGSVKIMTNNGLNFRKISELLDYALNNGLIIMKEERFSLTEEGESTLSKLSKMYKKIKKEEWVNKETDSMISKFDPDFIFLPDQHDLNLS